MTNISQIQTQLSKLGYYKGRIDGIEGSLTTSAIKAFQKDNNLQPDGIVGRLTSSKLFPQATQSLQSYIPFENTVQLEQYYGKPGTNQVQIEFPYAMYYDNAPIHRFTINKFAAEDALKVLQQVATLYSAKERAAIGLDQFSGCFANRNKRGGSSLSTHAYAISLDFDQARNQLTWGKEKARLGQADAVPFWECWEAVGWVSLGRTENRDWMHVQRARR